MEYRFYVKKGEKTYRAFKVVQNGQEDITVIPHQSVYLDRNFLKESSVGDSLQIKTEPDQATIHHFSAHSETGQRHVKFKATETATDPIKGSSFKNGSEQVIPIATMVVTTNRPEDAESSKGKIRGCILPNDTDYCVLDLVAVPMNMNVSFEISHRIENDRPSVETFSQVVLDLRTVRLLILVRTTNHNSCELPYNVFVQQTEGKTGQIVRVKEQEINIQVSNMNTVVATDEVGRK